MRKVNISFESTRYYCRSDAEPNDFVCCESNKDVGRIYYHGSGWNPYNPALSIEEAEDCIERGVWKRITKEHAEELIRKDQEKHASKPISS